MNYTSRNPYGLTLPFALILTFIFSALVGVSYLFVSVNLYQTQSNLQGLQAISIAEGVNERIKAMLNTKTKIKVSPQQEDKLKASSEDDELEGEEEDEELSADDEFDENAEDFDEYYADEVLKISRYITFREPKVEDEDSQDLQNRPNDPTNQQNPQDQNPAAKNPLAHVEMIGSIDVPTGTTLAKGSMIVLFKEEIIDLMLKEIVEDGSQIKQKLPIPLIKSLTPNYSEPGARASIVVNGNDLGYNQQVRFSNKDIIVEDLRAGPTIEILVNENVMPGLTSLYWNNVRTEYYIIPKYDGSRRPNINNIKISEQEQLLSAKAGQKNINIIINGSNLYLKKEVPVVLPDVVGIVPKVKSQKEDGTEIIVSLDINAKVEPGVHSLSIATEGGISNSWVFSVLASDKQEDLSGNIAKVSSSLTLLEVRVLENLLPIIGEDEPNTDKQGNNDPDEMPESNKLGPFANIDLETVWLLETTAKVGNTVRTVSEIINRQIPNVHAALITNGSVGLDGGGYQISGNTNSMTTLTEPTYISNTVLMVTGPPEEPVESIQGPDQNQQTPQDQSATPDQQSNQNQQTNQTESKEPVPKSPTELGFTPGSLATVYKDGSQISELDYAVISKVSRDTIEFFPPGLMDFHYEGDQVYQFTPPVISGEKIDQQVAEKHIIPKELAISIPNYANSQTIFKSDIEQFAELADLFTNDFTIPKDEFDLPVGYMGLTYIEGTPIFDSSNALSGKGILIIDTRSDNQGRPIGTVELSGDSKSTSTFSGVLYIKGNLRIDGNVTLNGAVVVDNEDRGTVQITSNALGKITYDDKFIKQSLVYTPFTTKAGSIMISNKPINLEGYVQSGTTVGASSGAIQTPSSETPSATKPSSQTQPDKLPEEALIEEEKGAGVQTIQIQPSGGKSAEEELIDLF